MSREGESAVKGDTKEGGGGVESKRVARNGKGRLKAGLIGIGGEEGNLAFGRVKREAPTT